MFLINAKIHACGIDFIIIRRGIKRVAVIISAAMRALLFASECACSRVKENEYQAESVAKLHGFIAL